MQVNHIASVPEPRSVERQPSSLPSEDMDARVSKLMDQTRFIHDTEPQPPRTLDGLEEKLHDALARCKVYTSSVSMHLEDDWRRRLFRQLDSLFDFDEWDEYDHVPLISSFQTFIRLMLLLKPQIRPGLGATDDGHLVAAWTAGKSRLTVECLPADRLIWSLVRSQENETHDRAAGEILLNRFPLAIEAYDPSIWFSHGSPKS